MTGTVTAFLMVSLWCHPTMLPVKVPLATNLPFSTANLVIL